jgi:hypothetical protein
MDPSPRPQTSVFFRACALVLFTWAIATAVMTERWWTRSVEGIPTPWIADRTASLGSALFVGMVGAALVAHGLSGRGLVRALAWGTAIYGLALAVVHVKRPFGTGPALLSAVALDVGAAMVAAMLLAIMLMAACWRWLGLLYCKRRQTERLGVGLLLGSGLWVAAIRTGSTAGAHASKYIDVVLFGPLVLAYLGMLGLTWREYWRILSQRQPQPASIGVHAMAAGRGTQPLQGAKNEVASADTPSARVRFDAATRRFALVDFGERRRDGDKTGDGEPSATSQAW